MNIVLALWANQITYVHPVVTAVVELLARYADKIIVCVLLGYIAYRLWKLHTESFHAGTIHLRAIAELGVAVLIGLFVSWSIKLFLAMPRPFDLTDQIVPLWQYRDLGSFPSGHAVFFMIVAIGMLRLSPRMGHVLFVCALLIPIARVMAGIHYPLDIIGGWMIGVVIALGIGRVFEWRRAR